jgi:hypothetical protein
MRIWAWVRRRADYLALACALAIVALPWLVFWPVTLGRQVWAGGDFSTYNYPMFVASAEQWQQGHPPLWNPYLFAGTPLAAAQQASVFYPLNMLLWLTLSPPLAMGFSVLIHLSLTGLGAFLFIRSLRVHAVAALLGALAFQMGGFAMSHLGHLPILRSLPWIGFALLGFNAWVNSGKMPYLCLVSISTGLLLVSGHPQVILYGILFVGTYFVFARHTKTQFVVLGLVALGLGIGLGAVQIMPGAHMWFGQEYLPLIESTYESFLAYSFHPAYLVTLIFPRARAGTYAEMVGYVGIASLLLSLFSLSLVEDEDKCQVRRFFAVWAVAALVLSCGRFVPILSRWLFSVPLYGSVSRVPSRYLLQLSFSLAVLAAFGLDGVIGRSTIRLPRRRVLAGLAPAMVGWIVLAYVCPFSVETPPLRWNTSVLKVIMEPLLLLSLSSVLLTAIWRTRNERLRRLFCFCLLALAVADLVDFGSPIYARGLRPQSFYEPSAVSAMIRSSQSDGPFRVISFEAAGDDQELLAPNYSAAYGVESLIGYEAPVFVLRRFYSTFDGMIPSWGYVSRDAVEQTQFRTLLNVVGVRYLLVRSEKTEPLARYYPRLVSIKGVDVYLNEQAYPRLFPAMSPAKTMKPPQTFGGRISLVDYSLRKTSDSERYALVTWWACQSLIADNYTLYVHYMDDDGNLLGQDDHLLIARYLGGPTPTGLWTCPGYYRDESYIPKELVETGKVQVALGLWIPETGQKLSSAGSLPVDQYGRTRLAIRIPEPAEVVSESVLLDEYGRMWIDSPTSVTGSTVQLLDYEGDRIEADVVFERDGLLVHGTNYASGWKARIDGLPVPILRVDGFLQGVLVPQGSHRVEFWYDPDSVKWGAVISAFSLGLVALIGLWPWRRRKSRFVGEGL